jgi:hypothetical protein
MCGLVVATSNALQEADASSGSFTVVAVKDGLPTDLQHVTGAPLTKQQLEALQPGKTVDGWPLLGVMMRELPTRREKSEKTPDEYISQMQAVRHRSRRTAS